VRRSTRRRYTTYVVVSSNYTQKLLLVVTNSMLFLFGPHRTGLIAVPELARVCIVVPQLHGTSPSLSGLFTSSYSRDVPAMQAPQAILSSARWAMPTQRTCRKTGAHKLFSIDDYSTYNTAACTTRRGVLSVRIRSMTKTWNDRNGPTFDIIQNIQDILAQHTRI
jgi:hypothetical protein